MFLDNFRNRYSFNFLSVCGWICFILILFYSGKEFYISYILKNTQLLWEVFVAYVFIAIFALIAFIIGLLIAIFEKIFKFKIIYEKFLRNRTITILQYVGVSFEILIMLFAILIFIYAISAD